MNDLEIRKHFGYSKNNAIVLFIIGILNILALIFSIYSLLFIKHGYDASLIVLNILTFISIIIYGLFGYNRNGIYFKIPIYLTIISILANLIFIPIFWGRIFALIEFISMILFVRYLDNKSLGASLITLACIVHILNIIICLFTGNNLEMILTSVVTVFSIAIIYAARCNRQIY